MLNIPDDFVKIKYNGKQNWLEAYLPNGELIPAVTAIHIHSEVSRYVRAEIHILVDARELEGIEIPYELKESKEGNYNHALSEFGNDQLNNK